MKNKILLSPYLIVLVYFVQQKTLVAILTRTYLMHVIVSAAKSPTRMERRPKRRLSKSMRLRSLEYSLRS